MTDSEFLLTEEFAAFSSNIKKIFDEKQENEAEFKKLWDAFKSKQAMLDDEAKAAHIRWEGWKEQQIGKQDVEDTPTS